MMINYLINILNFLLDFVKKDGLVGIGLFILTTLTIFEIVLKRHTKKRIYAKLKKTFFKFYNYVLKKPIVSTLFFTLSVVIFSLTLDKEAPNNFSNSHLISILGIIGIIGTIIGVILTYEQLKIAEDRIDGYESFYSAVLDLLKDDRSKIFQYYGATLIPGHIAYDNNNEILEFRNALHLLCTSIIKNNQKIRIITPTNDLYDITYKTYFDKRVKEILYTERKITEKLVELKAFKHSIESYCTIKEINHIKDLDIFNTYYVSNGITVIYCVPLHYQEARIHSVESENQSFKIEPSLIGFKTKNQSIVKAFGEYFEGMEAKLSN